MSGSPNLAGRLMPRRSAATKASATFADQLSSPGSASASPSARSDDSFIGGGGGGAERHSPSVKIRYGGKHKYHASPLKVTSTSSPERPSSTPRPAPNPKTKTKLKPRPSQKKRRRSPSPSPSPASSLSPPPSSAPPNTNSHTHPHTPKKAKLEKPTLSALDTSAPRTPPPGDGDAGSPLTEAESPLTPMSASPGVATSPVSAASASPPAFMKSLSQQSASARKAVAATTPAAKAGAKRKLLARPHTVSKAPSGSAKAKGKVAHVHTNGKGRSKGKGRSVYVDELGNFVFVLVGEDGKVAAGDGGGTSVGGGGGRNLRDASVQIIESMTWWPARVSRMRSDANNVLQVRLLGDNLPGSSSSSLVPVDSPSAANVRPMRTPNGELSFTASTCHYTPSAGNAADAPNEDAAPHPAPDSGAGSGHDSPSRPKKRPKSAWQAAVDKMVELEEQDKDGMPAFISSFRLDPDLDMDDDDDGWSDPETDGDVRGDGKKAPPASTSKRRSKKGKGASAKAKAKSKRDRPVDALDLDDDDINMDMDMDMDMGMDDDLPDVRAGDLVLSWSPCGQGFYWPARVLELIEPDKPGTKRKYRLEFMDDRKYNLTRDKFFTSDEKGFMTCNLGEWESFVQDVDAPDDDDNKPPPSSSQPPKPRSPSPEPLFPPPAKAAFAELPLRTQLAYAKPVLLATLRGVYAPALGRHRAFVKGGAARAAVQKDAGVRGEMATTEVADLRELISEWVLRGESRARVMEDVEDGGAGAGGGNGGDVNGVVPMDVDGQGSGLEPGEEDKNSKMRGGGADAQRFEELDTNRPSTNGNSAPPPSTPIKPDDASHQPHGEAHPNGKVAAVPSGAADLPHEEQPPAGAAYRGRIGAETGDKIQAGAGGGAGHVDGSRNDAGADDSQAGPKRVVGCEEYESLAGHEKVAYCTDVLLREAVQQLHLWRSGDRTSVDLLPDAEEARLHAIAVEKMDYRDWVWDVVRMREAQIRVHNLKNPEPKKAVAGPVAAATTGGTRSRPRAATVSRR